MDRQMVINEILAVWDDLPYKEKLAYLHGYPWEKYLDYDFLDRIQDNDTEFLVSELEFLITKAKRGQYG